VLALAGFVYPSSGLLPWQEHVGKYRGPKGHFLVNRHPQDFSKWGGSAFTIAGISVVLPTITDDLEKVKDEKGWLGIHVNFPTRIFQH
jgi:hypothetical protein